MTGRTAGTAALLELIRRQVPHTVYEYEHDPAERHFGAEIVAKLGLDAARTFKTLIVDLRGAGSRPVCAVVPVNTRLDLKALARVAGAKRADLIESARAERITGYRVGGISPIGQLTRLPTWIDSSATGKPTIWVSGGRRGLVIELATEDLVTLTSAGFAVLGRPTA